MTVTCRDETVSRADTVLEYSASRADVLALLRADAPYVATAELAYSHTRCGGFLPSMECGEGSSASSKQQSVQYKLAALYVQDALAGHLDNGKAQTSLAPLWVQRCFAVQTSQSFESVLLFASLAHMQLAWWEPASSFNPEGEYADWPAIGAEVVIVLLFLLDIGLKATYMGLRNYLSKSWHRQYLLLTLLLTVRVPEAREQAPGFCELAPSARVAALLTVARSVLPPRSLTCCCSLAPSVGRSASCEA